MLETPGALGFATRLDAEFSPKGWWFNGEESHEKQAVNKSPKLNKSKLF